MSSLVNNGQPQAGPGHGPMQQLNEKLEMLRTKLIQPSLSRESFIILISELQPLYTRIIIQDLQASVANQLESYLWTDCFKTPLTKCQTDKVLFNFIIETGIGFYLGFIQEIGMRFDVPFIRNSMNSMYCTNQMKQVVKTSSKSTVYYLIQNSLIHMGDLLRYGGSWIEAMKMYEKSTSLSPSNGHPYNQLGLVQLLVDTKSIDSYFSSIYYYTRAVSTSKPFVLAQSNLDSLLQKLDTLTATTPQDSYIKSFLHCIWKSSKFENTTPVPKVLNPQQAMKVLVIAIWKQQTGIGDQCSELIGNVINTILEEDDDLKYIGIVNIFLNWLHENKLINLKLKLKIQSLCTYLNKVLTNETELIDLDHVILSEEKKLLGFMPVAKCFEHLTSVMEETDERSQQLRINHTLKVAKNLASSGDSDLFQYKNGQFAEKVKNTRRNIALESIFSQKFGGVIGCGFGSGDIATTTTTTCSTLVECNSSVIERAVIGPKILPTSSGAPHDAFPLLNMSNQLTATPELQFGEQSEQDINNFDELFHSIWTPLEQSESIVWKY